MKTLIMSYHAKWTSCSAIQRYPALDGQDIISQWSDLTSSAQVQGVLAGAKSPSNVTVVLSNLSHSV